MSKSNEYNPNEVNGQILGNDHLRGPILIVDDEPDIIRVLEAILKPLGHEIVTAESGDQAVEIAKQCNPALLLLDLMIPGFDGFEVCRILKEHQKTVRTPILILSALGEEASIVRALELGADDYIVKPFSAQILIARIKSLLRRSAAPELNDNSLQLTFAGIEMDPKRFEVRIKGELTEFTATEFKILHLLIRNCGAVFTRSQIVDLVHGEDYPVTDRSIDVQIVGLRKKLGEFDTLLETVRGVGYRFKDLIAA
jgi:two-component system, OmpR family, alkaline phosphatase synthesis response regulator PhoP